MQSISENKGKSAIVTSALPYANGEIHLGHIASTYLPADIFTRFNRLLGREVYHICATDDFGTPVLIRAEKENKTPMKYVDEWNKRDYQDFKSIDISFDFFSKTSSKENIELVQYIFKKLYDNGHIYEKYVIQFYCQIDKKYLPDRYVIGRCPYCNAENQYSDLCENCGRVPDQILDPKCGICGADPIKKDSIHYFFKLSDFASQLRFWLTNNHNLQPDVKNYVINWIDEGLHDWDITRDISWGVSIPLSDAKGKVLYGWFDNHICYISSFKAFFQAQNKDGRRFWNESEIFHFIGKDIVYHHYLFLPAVRMGINQEYNLPDYIPTRGHLLLHDRKISKSRDWYISLREFTSSFNPDYLRFYLASITPYSQGDANFDWDVFRDKINNELISNVGNFINRTLTFIAKSFNSKVPSPSEFGPDDQASIREIGRIADEVGAFLSNNEFDKGLKRILAFSTYFNQFFQKKMPWSDSESARATLYISVNAVWSIGIILEPFIPTSAEKIWVQLGMQSNVHKEKWSSASRLNLNPGHALGNVGPIFQRIETKDIELRKFDFEKH